MKKIWSAHFLCAGAFIFALSLFTVIEFALNSSCTAFEINVFLQGKHDIAALLCSGESPMSHLIRNTRQRCGSQARSANSGNGNSSAALYGEKLETLCFFTPGRTSQKFYSCDDLWLDFINSALPVRAGPGCA